VAKFGGKLCEAISGTANHRLLLYHGKLAAEAILRARFQENYNNIIAINDVSEPRYSASKWIFHREFRSVK
jgi:hypothetical protein